MIIHLVFIWVGYRKTKGGKGKLLKELAFVPLRVKPGVDAWRVASDAEKEEGALIDPKAELNMLKVVELFLEAIPGELATRLRWRIYERNRGPPLEHVTYMSLLLTPPSHLDPCVARR